MRDLIHQLTRDHVRDGKYRVSLLAELQGETTPGRNTSGGSPKDELKLPVAAGTIDLYQRIRKEAYDNLWKWKHVLCAGTVEDTIQAFAYAGEGDDPGENIEYFTKLLQGWVDSIENLLRPSKPRRKIHAPCPACNEKYFGDERTVALTANIWDEHEKIMPPGSWDVVCGACGAEWKGEQLNFHVAALHTSKVSA